MSDDDAEAGPERATMRILAERRAIAERLEAILAQASTPKATQESTGVIDVRWPSDLSELQRALAELKKGKMP